MKERLLPKNTLLFLGVMSALSLYSVSRTREGTPIHWGNTWTKPENNIGVVQLQGYFDIFTFDNKRVHIEGTYNGFWSDKEYFSVGSIQKETCAVYIFRNTGEVIPLYDFGINAYSINSIDDQFISYYRQRQNTMEEIKFSRKTGEKEITNVFMTSESFYEEKHTC